MKFITEKDAQTAKEKVLRFETEAIFKQHDKKLNHIIESYVLKIISLEKTVS